MPAIIAKIEQAFYKTEHVGIKFESQNDECKQHGFLNILEGAGIIDRTTHLVKDTWLRAVYKQVGDVMIPGNSVMEGVTIEEAFFTNESANEVIRYATYALFDHLNDLKEYPKETE